MQSHLSATEKEISRFIATSHFVLNNDGSSPLKRKPLENCPGYVSPTRFSEFGDLGYRESTEGVAKYTTVTIATPNQRHGISEEFPVVVLLEFPYMQVVFWFHRDVDLGNVVSQVRSLGPIATIIAQHLQRRLEIVINGTSDISAWIPAWDPTRSQH